MNQKMKKGTLQYPKNRILNIKPSRLRADRAIIFFKCNSKLSAHPVMNFVINEINSLDKLI